MSHRLAYRPIWWGHFVTWGFFSDDSSLCQGDRKLNNQYLALAGKLCSIKMSYSFQSRETKNAHLSLQHWYPPAFQQGHGKLTILLEHSSWLTHLKSDIQQDTGDPHSNDSDHHQSLWLMSRMLLFSLECRLTHLCLMQHPRGSVVPKF